MKSTAKNMSVVIAGIFAAGLILDFLGSGTLGQLPKSLAQKITKGYGV